MRVAVLRPQVPFERGGTELLADELVARIRGAGHECDLITLPFKWYPHDRLLLDSLAWRQFDFSEWGGRPVDRIICTKYPSYLARHPYKVLWLFHQHRHAYDLFDGPAGDLRADAAGHATRDAIRDLDAQAMSECAARFAISANVADRLSRFNDVAASVLYPPPRGRERFHSGPSGDYLLSVSRLDPLKRIDLLLRAAARAGGTLRLKIAGEGESGSALRALAAELGLGGRVEFLGRVSDDALYELYAECRAVYYAPLDEDYGFATVEAMLSGKPVVTCTDSGGVLEFVTDEHTGWVSEPEPDALASVLGRAMAPGAAERLAGACAGRVAGLGWAPVLEALLA